MRNCLRQYLYRPERLRIVAFAVLVLLLCATVYGQQIPEAKREQGETYRFYWNIGGGEFSNLEPTTIIFPRLSTGDNTLPDGSDTSLINTSTLGPHTVWHVELHQLTLTRVNPWIVYSPAFPAGSTVVSTNDRIPIFTISGVPIDSVVTDTTGRSFGTAIQVLASN
jgi:hypothetical protein